MKKIALLELVLLLCVAAIAYLVLLHDRQLKEIADDVYAKLDGPAPPVEPMTGANGEGVPVQPTDGDLAV